MHKVCSAIKEEIYYFSSSSLKFLDHTGRKIDEFNLNWTFPDCKSSLNSQIATKWYTKLSSVFLHNISLLAGKPNP